MLRHCPCCLCTGAFDGESGSQTILLERCFGWRGLLLEANPTNGVTFLSLDVEGAELDVLLSLNLLERRPPFSVILVETSRYDGPRNAQIIKLLKDSRTGLAQLSHPYFSGSQNALFAMSDLKQPRLRSNRSVTNELLRRARAPCFITALKARNVRASKIEQMRQIFEAVPEIFSAALDAACA